ncbi:putative leucine-rich repeat-containing protein DDB_G0290503 isoform X2 [Hydra vulgaris]|uniref:putative leucine-rich repeat-containing protein DDB_G0290503 isoform X2 n=1 Tax=Hydra vulgaris TaxID=6087 RepID=UPI001F5F8831|nr:putative leucine-rich repeat-containing protein DDB_G0290503 isoform X2 [Hydra vulgaris]
MGKKVSDVNIDDLLDDEGWSLLNELTEEELELLNADFDPQSLLAPLNGRKGESTQNGPMFKKEDLVENLERIVAESIPVIKNEKIRIKEEVKKQVKEEKLKRQYSKDRPALAPQRSIALTDEEEELLNNATEEELIEAAEDVKQDFTRPCHGFKFENQDRLLAKTDMSSSLYDQHAPHRFHDKFNNLIACQENQSDNTYSINDENFKKLMQYHVKKKKRKKINKSKLSRIKKYNNFVLQYNSKIDSERLLNKCDVNRNADIFVNCDVFGDNANDVVNRDNDYKNGCNKGRDGDKFIEDKIFNSSKNDSLVYRKNKNNINDKVHHNKDNTITDKPCQMNLNIYINNSKKSSAKEKPSKVHGKNLSGILTNLGEAVTQVNFRIDIKLKADQTGIISTLTRCTVHPEQNNGDNFNLKQSNCATKKPTQKDITPLKSPNKRATYENESRAKREDRSGRQSCDSGICQTPTTFDEIFFDDGYGTLQNSYADGEIFGAFNDEQNDFSLKSDSQYRKNSKLDFQHQGNNIKKLSNNITSMNTFANSRDSSQYQKLEPINNKQSNLSSLSSQYSVKANQVQNSKNLLHSDIIIKPTSLLEETLKKRENESIVKRCDELKIEKETKNYCDKTDRETYSFNKKQGIQHIDCNDGIKDLDEVRSKLKKVRIDSEQKTNTKIPYDERLPKSNILVNDENIKRSNDTSSPLYKLLQQDKQKRESEKVVEKVVEADHRGVSAALLQQALLKMNGILTNEQISSVWAGEKPKGSSIRTTSSVKATEQRKCITQADEETELDIVELMRCCREDTDDLFYICINNQPNLERSIKLEVIKTVERSSKVKHLSMAMTGLIDFEVKELANALRYNSVMETLNLESNIITMHGILALMSEVGRHPSLREIKISNQKQPFGLQGEECMAAAIDKNENIIKFGYSFTQAGPRNKADRAIIRHNENLRQRRKNGEDVYDLKVVTKMRDEWPQPWIKVKGRRGLEKLIENKVLDMGHMSNGNSNEKMSDSSSTKVGPFNINDILTQRKSNSRGSKIEELEKEQERKRKQQFKEMEEYSNKIHDRSSKREEKVTQSNSSGETDYRRVAQPLPQSREVMKGINVNEILALRKNMQPSSKIKDLEKEQERKRREHFKEINELSKLNDSQELLTDNGLINTESEKINGSTLKTTQQDKQEDKRVNKSDKRVNESEKKLNDLLSKQASTKVNKLEELEKQKEKVMANENKLVNHEEKTLLSDNTKNKKNEIEKVNTKDKTSNEDFKTKTSSLSSNSPHVTNSLTEENSKEIKKFTEENAAIKNNLSSNNKTISNQPRELPTKPLENDARRNLDLEKKNNIEKHKPVLEEKKSDELKKKLQVDNKVSMIRTNKDSIELKQHNSGLSLNNSLNEKNIKKVEGENKSTEVAGKLQKMSTDKNLAPTTKNETSEVKKVEAEKITDQREAKKKEDEAKIFAEEKINTENNDKRQKLLFDNKNLSNKDSRSGATFGMNKGELDKFNEQRGNLKKEEKNVEKNNKLVSSNNVSNDEEGGHLNSKSDCNKDNDPRLKESSRLSSIKSEVKNKESEKFKEQIENIKNKKEEKTKTINKDKKVTEESENKQKVLSDLATVENKTSGSNSSFAAPSSKDNSFGMKKGELDKKLKETKTKEEENNNLVEEKKKVNDIAKKQELRSANNKVDNTSGTKVGTNTKASYVKNGEFNKPNDNRVGRNKEDEANKKIEETKFSEKAGNKEKLPLDNKNVNNKNDVSYIKSDSPEVKKVETSKLNEYRERKKEEGAKKLAEEKGKNEETESKQKPSSDNKNVIDKNDVLLSKNNLLELKKGETNKLGEIKDAKTKDSVIERKQITNNNDVSFTKSKIPEMKKEETDKLSEYREKRKKEEEAKKIIEDKKKSEETDKKQKLLSDNKNLTDKNDASLTKSRPFEVKNDEANKLSEYREARKKEEDKKLADGKKKLEADKKQKLLPDNKTSVTTSKDVSGEANVINTKDVSGGKNNFVTPGTKVIADVSNKDSKSFVTPTNDNMMALNSNINTVSSNVKSESPEVKKRGYDRLNEYRERRKKEEEVKKQSESKNKVEEAERITTEPKEVRKKEDQSKTIKPKEDESKRVSAENVLLNAESGAKKVDSKCQVLPKDEKKVIVEDDINVETRNVCNASPGMASTNNFTNNVVTDIFSGRTDDNNEPRLSLKERMARRGK